MANRARTTGAGLVLITGDDAPSSAGAPTLPPSSSSTAGPWEDPDFPARQVSIDGMEAPPVSASSADDEAGSGGGGGGGGTGKTRPGPRCTCGQPAGLSKVKGESSSNQGRFYYHCSSRACRFFAWSTNTTNTDSDSSGGGGGGGKGKEARKPPLSWKRLHGTRVVNDFGFRASDLAQGGLGDCWVRSGTNVALLYLSTCATTVHALWQPDMHGSHDVGGRVYASGADLQCASSYLEFL